MGGLSFGAWEQFFRNEFNEANFKLALNLEYRFDLFGSFKGALFTDVGNIWNVFDDVTDPKRRFDGFEDLSELAVGSGFGVRYDFGLFIFHSIRALKPIILHWKNRRDGYRIAIKKSKHHNRNKLSFLKVKFYSIFAPSKQ